MAIDHEYQPLTPLIGPLKPPFEVEFPDDENWQTDKGHLYEVGLSTPAMLVGRQSETTGEADIPLSTEEAEQLLEDETRAKAEKLAIRHGGKPDDYDWRYQ